MRSEVTPHYVHLLGNWEIVSFVDILKSFTQVNERKVNTIKKNIKTMKYVFAMEMCNFE